MLATLASRVAGATWTAASNAAGVAAGALTLGVAGAAGAVGVAKGMAEVLPRAARMVPEVVPSAAMPAALVRQATSSGRALLDLNPRRQRRRVWANDERAHIEVRGLDGGDRTRLRRLGNSATTALGRMKGVRWAQVNAVTGQVLVAFDERHVGVGTLLDTVRAVEKSYQTQEQDFSWSRPIHPGDSTPVAAAAAELTADLMAAAAATAQAAFRFSPVPRQVRAVLAVLDLERGLRRGVKRRIGPLETDLVLSLADSVIHGLTQGIAAPAVDAVYRSMLLMEVWSRRRVWRRREPSLAADPSSVPGEPPARPPRPAPRPQGPIEAWYARLGPAAPAAAGTVLALTRQPGRAADALLAAVPRAAKYGRQGFATVVGAELARRGVVPLDAAVLRRLDRISAVVLDSNSFITQDGELHSLADAIVDAATTAVGKVWLTEHPTAEPLIPRVTHVLPADAELADHVRRLQAEGHGVLVVSGADADALAAADVGVSVPGGEAAACWSSDLVCGTNFEDVWRILRALQVARPVSQGAVQLAQAGSALALLIATVGDRRHRVVRDLSPVHLAAFIAMIRGATAGLRAMRTGAPRHVVHVPWHELDGLEVFARLMRTRESDGDRSRRVSWPTELAPGLGWLGRYARDASDVSRAVRDELRDPLTPVLGVGALASAIVGSAVDGVLVGAVLAGNAVISGIQRVRAERALRGLVRSQELWARRLHIDDLDELESAEVEPVRARDLVPGDVIELRTADLVPADARLLRADDLEVDEASLTGESVPVVKDSRPVDAASVAERSSMLFEGTSVLAGSAHAVVVATGASTEASRAARAVAGAPQRAGVQARLQEVVRIALPLTAIGGAAVTALALVRGVPLRSAVAAGVSVAVAAVPEGLPLVATVAQAGAARRLSKHGVLVRASRALEALGRVDVVCIDKTGTLTEGRLRLARVATTDDDLDLDDPAAQRILATAGRACPQVGAEEISSVRRATDRAVLEAAVAAGDIHLTGWQLRAELPFEPGRGYSAALGEVEGGPTLVVKGAPEAVLPKCRRTPDVDVMVDRLATDGLRVLAVAERREGIPEQTTDLEPLVDQLTFVGFVGIADTPRPDAAKAVQAIRAAGADVVMLTGDHPITAQAIARATGMADGDVLTGAELRKMSESERVRRVGRCTIFARVTPEDKAQIVKALQDSGHVAAMIGDGINDAAAIRRSDVGIGINTERSTSARSAADLILTEPDLGRVSHVLLEGRALWGRVRDAVSILVGGNAGEVAFMVIGTALAGRAPMTTRQMLLVNMLTDMFPALAVALAPSRNGDEPNGPVGSTLSRPLARAVAVRGAGTTLGATLAWAAGRLTGRRRRASTMGLAALVATQLGQTLLTGRHSRLVVLTSVGSFFALVAAVQTPGLSHFLGCCPLGPVAWGIVLTCAAAGTVAAAVATARASGQETGLANQASTPASN